MLNSIWIFKVKRKTILQFFMQNQFVLPKVLIKQDKVL